MNVTLTDGDPAVQLDLTDLPDTGKGGQSIVVQNLGDGDVYFDASEDVDETTGVKIAVDGFYEFATDGTFGLYFMADGGDADLRYTAVG